MFFMYWYTAPSPSSVVLMSLTDDIFARNAFSVACKITLPSTVDVPVNVDAEWSEPVEATLNSTSPVMTENPNVYVSISDLVSDVQSGRISFQCTASVSSNSSFIIPSESKAANASVFVVGRPSQPIELDASPGSTFIRITWSKTPNDIVHEYELHYSYHIRECQDFSRIMNSTIIGNSTKSYTLMNLEEDSEFIISLTASNPAGESEPATVTATTLSSGTVKSVIHIVIIKVCLTHIQHHLEHLKI